ncbi:MAG: hypothetical protein ACUVQV_08800 [Dissulfurimicrobium sp.]|uniref:hypothetical protein n=1 Tax=Dissulfurimicrobium sp. TaxID=2022436 RepID=UPI00404A42E0
MHQQFVIATPGYIQFDARERKGFCNGGYSDFNICFADEDAVDSMLLSEVLSSIDSYCCE